MVKVADYVADFLESRSVNHVFMVTGGGAMFLNDGIAKSKIIKGVFNHHEQASAMGAVAYSKVTNKVAVVMPTTGCGGTNTITGLLDAWQDSNKVVFISGNVNRKETTHGFHIPLRKFGVQEANIVEIVKPITKYAVMVTDPKTISYHLEKAFHLCETGRPGPVWIDIPMDVQGSFVREEELMHFTPDEENDSPIDCSVFEKYLANSKRPIVIAGYGVHLSGAREHFIEFVEKHNLPVALTYLGVDLIPSDHPLYVGRLGTKGDRAGNFAVQNSDLVISLGSSLSVSVTGFRYDTFARESKVLVVDIDKNEHKKNTIKIDAEINTDLKNFFNLVKSVNLKANQSWVDTCIRWRNKWPVFLDKYKNTENGINIYYFIEMLSKYNLLDSITVSDAGSAYYATSQGLKIRQNQKYITSGAQAEMGFSIPAAIGAAIASGNPVVAITGDGSFQMNIQELQTIVNYKLPIKVFVLNNGGYLSIRNTMDKFFESRYFGTDEKSGISFPEISKIAFAYGMPYHKLISSDDLNIKLPKILNSDGFALIEVVCLFKQDMSPSSSAKINSEGKLISQPLENMSPFLDEEEFKQEMIVDPL